MSPWGKQPPPEAAGLYEEIYSSDKPGVTNGVYANMFIVCAIGYDDEGDPVDCALSNLIPNSLPTRDELLIIREVVDRVLESIEEGETDA